MHILEVSLWMSANLEPEAFSGTLHVLKVVVSMKQQFLEHEVFWEICFLKYLACLGNTNLERLTCACSRIVGSKIQEVLEHAVF